MIELGILIVLGFFVLHRQLRNIERKVTHNMAKLDARVAAIETRLDEAAGEILAEIQKLKENEQLSAEGLATLDRLELKANALADIVPNAPPPEPPVQ